MNRLLFIAWVTSTCLLSCTSSRPTHSGNYIQIEKLAAKVRLFHLNADSSRIFFSFDARPQDYYLLSDQRKFKAAYRLTYELVHTEGGKKTRIDSSSLKLVDLQPRAALNNITAFVDTRLPDNKNYSLKLSITNINNGARYDYYSKFDKNNCTAAENILIMAPGGKPLLEKNYVDSEGKILLKTGCGQNLALKLIKGGVSFPAPPFTSDDYSSKNNYSTFDFNLDQNGDTYDFSNLEKGVYLVTTGENSGVIFYHFNKWYPNCNDTSAFYEPLIFISSRDEFDAFKGGTQAKKSFETFWLSKAGDQVSARKAIKEYYKRVFEANAEFTSVNEGWRTDRGMVYVVFGKPGYVEKQLNKEIWIYRTAFNTSLSFVFNKIDNPYSDNDYRLERDPRYKPHWYNAVENWRRGKAFSLNGN